MKGGVVVANYNRFFNLLRKTASRDIMDSVTSLDLKEQDITTTGFDDFHGRTDVIITGGMNYRLFKKSDPAVPVLPFEIHFPDFLYSISEALKHGRRVVLITSRELPWKHKLSEIFKADIRHITSQSHSDMRSKILSLAGDCDCIIGMSWACDIADEAGIKNVFLGTSYSVNKELEKALILYDRILKERYIKKKVALVLDFLQEGVLVTDREEKIVLCNQSAARIMEKSSEDVRGRRLGDIMPWAGEYEKMQLKGIKTLPFKGDVFTLEDYGDIMGKLAVVRPADTNGQGKANAKVGNRPKDGFLARYTLDDIAGVSESIEKAKKLAAVYAKDDCTVLLTGETGTGKELFAHGIHNRSPRKNGPFVPINCAALPENLIESELFGYEEGAFTGARTSGKRGLLELASRGTLFLDEMGNVSKSIQLRLLRVLEEKVVFRVGSDKLISVDARIIASTNTPLSERVEEMRFRSDLFYRLNVANIKIPPLRERREDLPSIMQALLKQSAREWMLQRHKKEFMMVLERLADYSFPGNVREFRNIIDRLCIVLANGLEIDFVFQDLCPEKETGENKFIYPGREDIRNAFQKAGGNRSKTAEILRISRTTLWRRMKDMGI